MICVIHVIKSLQGQCIDTMNDRLLLELSIALHETIRQNFPEIENLKPPQVTAITHFVLRNDVFAVLPTGMGKSLIFQVLPDMCSRLNRRGYSYPSNAILLVICPLVSLVESQMKELEKRQISSAYLAGDNVDKKGIKAGQYSVVFSSPESLLMNPKWREMLRSEIYQANLFGIVTDEVHVVPKW